mmetsp:Transcript_26172/g.68731  ORF Transcript_26172/g.68731 Transcript_26172/m.68731 type:complete len:210 (+) Transcript_26172:33-662(+)
MIFVFAGGYQVGCGVCIGSGHYRYLDRVTFPQAPAARHSLRRARLRCGCRNMGCHLSERRCCRRSWLPPRAHGPGGGLITVQRARVTQATLSSFPCPRSGEFVVVVDELRVHLELQLQSFHFQPSPRRKRVEINQRDDQYSNNKSKDHRRTHQKYSILVSLRPLVGLCDQRRIWCGKVAEGPAARGAQGAHLGEGKDVVLIRSFVPASR